MRILLVTDPPMVAGAYAQQGFMLARRMIQAGHKVLIYAPTYTGAMLNYQGVDVVGGLGSPDWAGTGLIPSYAERFQADIIMTLKDVYVYNPDVLKILPVPWIPICPVDTEPVSLTIKGHLNYAAAVIALTRHSQQLLADEQIRAEYAPHGIETDFWTPGDKQEARARLGLPPQDFIAAFVGTNMEFPSRKNIDQIIFAWAQFLAECPDQRGAVLFLHTSLSDVRGGLDLELLLNNAGLSPESWRVSDQMKYEVSGFGPEYLRDLYRAADVLLAPSAGEGFCVPVVEAQACGTPVIATQWSALRETAGVGWQIQAGEPFWTGNGGFWFRPSRRALVDALKIAVKHKDDPMFAQAARVFACKYDMDRVFMDHWLPILRDIEGILQGKLGGTK